MFTRLARAVSSAARSLWLLGGSFLLCLLVIEFAARIGLRLTPAEQVIPGSVEGVERVYLGEEAQAAGFRWHSYVYWRAAPHEGTYEKVDENGLRRTWNQPTEAADALKVFFFGGSTCWGSGTRDEFTIPSVASKVLSESDAGPVVVTNFAQSGYVHTQELITLMLELRNGNVPDAVVFYDGVNDIWTAYQARTAGLPQNEVWRRLDFESARLAFLFRVARNSAGVQVAGRLFGDGGPSGPRHFSDRPATMEDLADAALDAYVGNMKVADALAQSFGFDVLYVWQPVIWSKSSLTPAEELLAQKMEDRFPSMERIYRASYERVGQRSELVAHPRFLDLSGALDDLEPQVYFDYAHVSEIGNERVGQLIAKRVGEIIEQRRRE